MGLFSRKTEVYVSSVTYSLGEDPEKIPDLLQAAVITASIQDQSRPAAIKRTIFEGNGIKLRQGFSYAKKNYYAGLPTGFPRVLASTNDAQLTILVKEYLEKLYLPPNVVEVKNVTVEYDNNFLVRAKQLIEVEFSYDFYDNAVYQANNGIAVDATLEITRLPADELNHPDDLGFHLVFTNPDTSTVVIDKWYPEINFIGQETVENRVIVEYSLNSAPAMTMYYAFGGGDSRLNIFLRTLETPEEQTFPALVLKKALTNKKAVYLNDDLFTGSPWASSAVYKTTKRYGERMGIDIDEILATLKSNADEKQIDYAFIQPGTKINSPNTAVHEYHYRYFERMYTKFPDNKPAYDAWVTSCGNNQETSKSKADSCPAQSIRIQDLDDTKNSVNMEIAWRYITYEEKVGTLAKPFVVECGPQEIQTSRYRIGRGLVLTVRYDVTKLYLRKRLTPTTYAELCVCGLWHENYIYKNHSVQSAVWEAFYNEEDDFGTGFVIPLQYDVYMALSAREQLQLAQESVHLILNCYKIVKQKWYQTGIFKMFMIIIAVVVIVYSWGTTSGWVAGLYEGVKVAVGTALGAAASATLVAAIAATITAVIVVSISVGVSMVAKEAGEWAAEHWGPAWGAVVQIVAIFALTYAMGMGLESSLNMAIPAATLPMTVLNVTNAVLSGLATYTSAEMALIKEAQEKWTDYINSPNNPMEELNRLMEELFPEMNLVQEAVLYAPLERMDQFLNRTLTLVDGLTYRLTLPIEAFSELTLTPRLT